MFWRMICPIRGASMGRIQTVTGTCDMGVHRMTLTAPSQLNERAIDLAPPLPTVSYYAMERWHSERIRALALYCSDGRWGEAFDEFCHQHLQIPRYDRWAVPGGPSWLAGHPQDVGLLDAARTQLDFLVQAHDLERIVLITH